MDADPPPNDEVSLRATLADDVLTVIPEAADDISGRPVSYETSVDFIRRLHGGLTPEDALAFAAHAFQPRYAVWWGYECLMARPELLTAADQEMLAVAAHWVAAQDDASRTEALTRALDAERGAGRWIALGVGWSDGSMVAPDHPPVPFPKFMVGRAVSTGVLLFLSRVSQAERRRWLAQFVFMAQSLSVSG